MLKLHEKFEDQKKAKVDLQDQLDRVRKELDEIEQKYPQELAELKEQIE